MKKFVPNASDNGYTPSLTSSALYLLGAVIIVFSFFKGIYTGYDWGSFELCIDWWVGGLLCSLFVCFIPAKIISLLKGILHALKTIQYVYYEDKQEPSKEAVRPMNDDDLDKKEQV